MTRYSGTQLSALPQVDSYEIQSDCSGGDLRRPALPYFGGKWRIARWIIEQFPEHKTYCEPYAGAFSVGLRKPSVDLEILNELNPEVVNFFQVLKQWPRELVTALDASPRTREEFETCKVAGGDTLERARRFYLYCQMSYGNGGGRWSSGTSNARLDQVETQDCSYLLAISKRLAKVHIEARDALVAIAIHDTPDTLFYVDPCYVHSSRGSKDKRHINGAPRRQYRYEMTNDDHRQLAEHLHACEGMVVLSGHDSDLYAELFPGWRCVKKASRTSSRKQRTECVWIKPTVGETIWLPVSDSWAPGTIRDDGLIDFGEADLVGVWGAWASRHGRQSPPEQESAQQLRKHRPKGGASGWLETRTGNKKRKNPSVSYYYRWDSPKGRVTEYVKGSKLSAVRQMLAADRPALEILKVVVDGKKKLSGVSAELLGKCLKNCQEKEQLDLMT